jgi:RNA polymerase sigma-70 factor (ECF subfamily)
VTSRNLIVLDRARARRERSAGLPAFETLVRGELDAMHRLAAAVVGSDDAADVVQEASLRAYQSYAELRDGGRARTWLLRILHRCALNHRRARARRPQVDDTSVVSALRAPSPDVAQRLVDRESLERAFASLDGTFAEVLWLIDGEGVGIAEAAEILEISAGTVASRLFRARTRIRVHLRGDLPEGSDHG